MKIYQTESISTPCLYGFLQPAIYIPAFLVSSEGKEGVQESLSEKEITQIIVHELVHYKHWDHIWSAVRVILVSVYWFHPLLWLAAAYSKRDAEFACDESTIYFLGEEQRFCYGETLIKLAGSCRRTNFLYPMTSMSNQGKGLEKRIHALSEKKKQSKLILLPLIVFMVLVLGVTFSNAVFWPKDNISKKTVENKPLSNNKKKNDSSTIVENKEAEEGMDNGREEWEILYTNFLRDHAKDASYQYYSIADLGVEEPCYVLLIAEEVSQLRKGVYGAVGCRVYNCVNHEVTLCGEIACSSSGEWVRTAARTDRMLMVNSHHSVTHVWAVDKDTLKMSKIVEETKKSGDSQYKIYNDKSDYFMTMHLSDYEKWVDEFYQSPGVVFYGNPFGGGKDKIKNSPKESALFEADMNYASYTKENEAYYVYADLTEDGKDETIEVNLSNAIGQPHEGKYTVKVYSGKTKKVIWKVTANATVHSAWNGVYLYLGKEAKRRPALLIWNPTVGTGMASYHWELFDLTDTGKVRKIDSDRFDYSLEHPKKSDITSLRKCVKGVNRYLLESQVLISTYPQDRTLFGINYNQNASCYDLSAEIEAMKESLEE